MSYHSNAQLVIELDIARETNIELSKQKSFLTAELKKIAEADPTIGREQLISIAAAALIVLNTRRQWK